MSDNIIAFPLTANSANGGASAAGNPLAERYAVALLELARFACGEPPGCTFRGYCWIGGELRAQYEHGQTGFVAAFGYDARTRKLIHICPLGY